MESIPQSISCGKDINGWKEQVEPERESLLFWQWIWLEAGKPNNGTVYDVIKRARHIYHYAIR